MKLEFKSFTVLANTVNCEYLTGLRNLNEFHGKTMANPNLDQPHEKATIKTRTDIKAKGLNG